MPQHPAAVGHVGHHVDGAAGERCGQRGDQVGGGYFGAGRRGGLLPVPDQSPGRGLLADRDQLGQDGQPHRAGAKRRRTTIPQVTKQVPKDSLFWEGDEPSYCQPAPWTLRPDLRNTESSTATVTGYPGGTSQPASSFPAMASHGNLAGIAQISCHTCARAAARAQAVLSKVAGSGSSSVRRTVVSDGAAPRPVPGAPAQ